MRLAMPTVRAPTMRCVSILNRSFPIWAPRGAISPRCTAWITSPPIPPFAKSNPTPVTRDRWTSFSGANVDKIVRLTRAHNIDSHFWIQGFDVPADDAGYMEGADQLGVKAGITNLAAWPRRLQPHLLSRLRAAGPRVEDDWQTLWRVQGSKLKDQLPRTLKPEPVSLHLRRPPDRDSRRGPARA